MYEIEFTRKGAFKLAWTIFWMATGTRKMSLKVDSNGEFTINGVDLIGKEI